MSISQSIGEELDRQARRDRDYLEGPHERELMQGGTDNLYDATAIVELTEAQYAHGRYSRAEEALRKAGIALEAALYPYIEDMRHQAFRGTVREAEYRYLTTLFDESITAIKTARKLNDLQGDFTATRVEKAKAAVNPEIQKQAAEQTKDAERATKFCGNFLTWLSECEETLTGETK